MPAPKPRPAAADWHRADIKAALEKAGWSLRRLSLARGLVAGSLRCALAKRWVRGERLIAEAIGVSPEEIWPSRYDERRLLRGVGGSPTHKTGARPAPSIDKGTGPGDSFNGNLSGEA